MESLCCCGCTVAVTVTPADLLLLSKAEMLYVGYTVECRLVDCNCQNSKIILCGNRKSVGLSFHALLFYLLYILDSSYDTTLCYL